MIRLRGAQWGSIGSRYLSAEAQSKRKTTIQPAIQRSHTDILKALADTVKTDPTAPHFSFIDDPTTIPSTIQMKRNYFMAKEMGKRAARQLAEEWPTLFQFDRDQPYLPAFRPEKAADPLQVAATEENLLKMIEEREVKDGSVLYERMRAEDIEVSEKTQIKLLQLATYYNSSNPPFAELDEWHGLRTYALKDYSEWKKAGLADLLFETLPKTAETVSMLICGLCKHGGKDSYQRARELYKEHATLPLYREAFDSLIKMSPFEESKKYLRVLVEKNIEPRLSTWNALLSSASQIKKSDLKVSAFESVIGEMIASHQEPSLYSYSIIFDNLIDIKALEDAESRNTSDANVQNQLKHAVSWLVEVLHKIENKPIDLVSKGDYKFFLSAMAVASRASNLEMAEKIVAIYEEKSNSVKLPGFLLENTFYNRYLMLYVSVTDSIENIHRKYIHLVPRLVGVSRMLTMAVAEKLKLGVHWPLVLRLVEDGICSQQMTDFRVSGILRECLTAVDFQSLSAIEREQYRKLILRMVDIWTEYSRFTEERQQRLQMKLSPIMISEVAVLLNRIGESEQAFRLLEMLLNPENSTGEEATVMATGYCRQNALNELFDDALKQRDAIKASICFELLSTNTPRNKLEMLSQRIHDRCFLTDVQSRIINGFVRLRPQ